MRPTLSIPRLWIERENGSVSVHVLLVGNTGTADSAKLSFAEASVVYAHHSKGSVTTSLFLNRTEQFDSAL